MGYDQIRLNLPGMGRYDPSLPKIMKWNTSVNAMAGDVVTFVDDCRLTGYSKENCHAVHRQFASRIQYLGMQDAPRKFRPPSQAHAGAWTGTIFKITPTSITKTVSSEKWIKGRGLIQKLMDSTPLRDSHDERTVNRKELERITGFLNHLAMTFEDITPFLKGFYLTLNSWREKRSDDGWKVSDKLWLQLVMDRHDRGLMSDDELDQALEPSDSVQAPGEVKICPRFITDVDTLSRFFELPEPPAVSLRTKKIVTVVYGFGDASGSGLGATFTDGNGFSYRVGVWGSSDSLESSNWKEFTNTVESLEDEAEHGNLRDSEVFMFTDNATVEACAEKGSSSSPKLLDLVVRLRLLANKAGIKLHIFHVSGTQMIAQGTDGVSRGFLAAGIMDGQPMESFIPIHLSAPERSRKIIDWVKGWSSPKAKHLNPMGWFEEGHDIIGWEKGLDGFERPLLVQDSTFIWTPPPFAAEVALAELRKARIKRQTSAHIVIVPRLCTTLWQRQLFKACNLVFQIPAGSSEVWPAQMHEPLLIGLIFPFISAKPWQLRGTPKMFVMGRELHGVFSNQEMDSSPVLRKFWARCLGLRNVSEAVVRKMLYFE